MAAVQALSRVYPLDSRLDEAGRLEIGGCDALDLAREFGTPAYVVAEDDLRARARAFRDALATHHPGPGRVLFASKAFPCTAVLRVFAEEGLGADVASGGELHLALRAGMESAAVVLHGNAKSEDELAAAVDAGVGLIAVDGLGELERLERVLGPGRRQPVLLRVTPGVRTATHAAIATGQDDSKFGFNLDDGRAAIERVRASARLELRGLHVHVGSQLTSLAPLEAAVAALAPLDRFGTYDLGGGLGVAYRDGDDPPGVDEYVGALVRAAHAHLGADAGTELLLEPGRALVANAGVTLYRVESVKRNVSTWVAVDGGMSDNLRPMLYGARYEAAIADRFPTGDDAGEPCHLAGKHCESGDVLIRDASLRDPRPGDVVVTPATGAYGHALANNYNGLPRPPVIFCSEGRARVVVRRETFADLSARDVD